MRISDLVDMEGLGDRGDQAAGERLDHSAALHVLDDDGEFVAAHPADMAERPDLLDQALGDALQHRVALRVAERVVDRLEAVEIEEQDRAGRVAPGRARQSLAEQLADPAAIGQAGKHVHIGEVGQPLLGAADVGHVLADAAKALELAAHVDDRIARQADPARAAPGGQLHFEIGEGLARQQDTAERAGAAERRRQRMAGELVGRAADQSGHPRGDVDDAILAIDLPQPADAAMLIFVEQLADRFGLGAGSGEALELAEDPARQPRHAERADAGEQQESERELGIERAAAIIISEAEASGQGRDPGDRGRRDGGERDRRRDHRRHRAADDDLDAGRLGGEGPGRQRRPEAGEADRLDDGGPARGRPRGAAAGAGGGDHRAAARDPIEEGDQRDPADDQLGLDRAVHAPADDQRGEDRGDREEGGEESARLDLAIVQMGGAKPLVAGVEIHRLGRRRGDPFGVRPVVNGNRRMEHRVSCGPGR